MSKLTIPAVVTRNQSSITDNDWKNLLGFFKHDGSTEAFVAYCENKLGIKSQPPEPKPSMSIEQRKEDLTKRFEAMNKELEALEKEEKEQTEAANALVGQTTPATT